MNIKCIKKVSCIAVTTILLCTLGKCLKAQDKKAQESSPFLKLNKEKLFKPVVSVQSWATYSISDNDNVANRANVSFRRFRFGGSGNPYSWLKYSFQLHADRLNQDTYSAVKGSYSGIGIWNAYLTAKLLKNSDFLNLEAGYFWAVIGRESDTSPWAVASLDKTTSSWYLRRFNTGVGNGMLTGIALGGIKNYNKFGISYRIGSYEPSKYQLDPKYANRLYTGRLMFSFGDPEQKAYKFCLSENQWAKRKGITLGFGAASMGKGVGTTSIDSNGNNVYNYFDNSSSYGADLAIDYKGLRIDGEYYKMKRKLDGVEDFDGKEFHIRLAYNFIAANMLLEPSVTYDKFEGEGTKSLVGGKLMGEDKNIDFGVNWYASKSNLKIGLHYISQDGTSGQATTDDYLGIVCQIKL